MSMFVWSAGIACTLPWTPSTRASASMVCTRCSSSGWPQAVGAGAGPNPRSRLRVHQPAAQPRVVDEGLVSDRVVISTIVAKYLDHLPRRAGTCRCAGRACGWSARLGLRSTGPRWMVA